MPPITNNDLSKNSSGSGFIRGLIVFVVLAALAATAIYNKQSIIDWARLRDYHPPSAIARLVKQDTMTAYGRKVFYVNEPVIESKRNFQHYCANQSEKTIVIGCYHSDQQGIYVLKVTDQRLNGIEQVTAAHEMLHAAYDRLSSSERQKVDNMLLNYYRHDLHNSRILSTLADYRKTEPNDVVNEMHSIFGTEIGNLPAGLKNYYKQYFTNRARVVSFAASYQGEFTSRKAAIARYGTQLAVLKQQIDNLAASLKAKKSQLDQESNQLNSYKAAGDIQAYNAGVPRYNAHVQSFNGGVADYRNLINQYNGIVAQRNAVVLEEQQLMNDISSHVSPIK